MVAVDAESQWILHGGDAFYHHGQLAGGKTAPLAMTVMGVSSPPTGAGSAPIMNA
ncbi:hypothetical protein [Nocardia acidivorans]|uniref:hypothetical protein n=1 Tax=Nocardia acidivorans TaxID=404580 RepID=UPI000B2F9A5F|nr:hypothetical protein [Nocardia acidivorans]